MMKNVAVALALMLLPRAGAAQDPRLGRLAPDARALVAPLVDSAHAAGLPTEPLVNRALEGASKGAAAPLIVAAVRRLAADLGRARDALGPAARTAELAAAADALRAGASPAVLQRLRDALGVRRLAVPLGVTADLTARGVPADTAATLVITLARSVEDAQLLALQREVERDIALGAPPLAAAAGRLGAEDFVNVASPRTEPTGTGTSATPVRRKP
ncbi:MAG: hypothetical protein HYT81_02165 [Gemmatimonadetes bacterium]|nr:hypothetical protein [Gemmatimonadota bacterium]MBI2402210.1 hypothetical protein [Gemmatimonadota bacterium]